MKPLHIALAVLSGAGFALRGYWMLTASPWWRARITRTVPHLVDSALLLSAIAMLWVYQWDPFQAPWLNVKLGALVVYIGLGATALRPGPRRRQVWALLAALLVLGFIFSVALTHHPAGVLVLLT